MPADEGRTATGRLLLCAQIRARRTRAGLQLAELADLADISQTYLSEIERGYRPEVPQGARRWLARCVPYLRARCGYFCNERSTQSMRQGFAPPISARGRTIRSSPRTSREVRHDHSLRVTRPRQGNAETPRGLGSPGRRSRLSESN
ncbi:helix-turn-helix transcriptional regulator [Nocardioides sp.]|uniref:helix-turn-helix domain-containing protein n=1 Tax=Nocardioides sp. TaxID=35761 RepID=UPI00341A312B